jgi:hypothetical protein
VGLVVLVEEVVEAVALGRDPLYGAREAATDEVVVVEEEGQLDQHQFQPQLQDQDQDTGAFVQLVEDWEFGEVESVLDHDLLLAGRTGLLGVAED